MSRAWKTDSSSHVFQGAEGVAISRHSSAKAVRKLKVCPGKGEPGSREPVRSRGTWTWLGVIYALTASVTTDHRLSSAPEC